MPLHPRGQADSELARSHRMRQRASAVGHCHAPAPPPPCTCPLATRPKSSAGPLPTAITKTRRPLLGIGMLLKIRILHNRQHVGWRPCEELPIPAHNVPFVEELPNPNFSLRPLVRVCGKTFLSCIRKAPRHSIPLCFKHRLGPCFVCLGIIH